MKTAIRGIALFLATVLSIGLFAACDSSGSSDKDGDEEKENTVSADAGSETKKGTITHGGTTPDSTPSGNRVLTVEEIGEMLVGSENLKIMIDMVMETEMDVEGITIYMKSVNRFEGAQDGDLVHQISTATNTSVVLGEETTESEREESYQVKNGGNVTVYTKDEDTGSWSSETMKDYEVDSEMALEGMEDLFTSANYGEFDASTGRYTLKEGANAEFEGMTVTGGYIECREGSYTLYMDLYMDMSELGMGGLVFKTTMTFSDFGKVSLNLPAEIAG